MAFFKCLFIYFERERVQGRGRERGRERESYAGSALSMQSLNPQMARSRPEPKSNQESEAELSEPPKHPRTSHILSIQLPYVVSDCALVPIQHISIITENPTDNADLEHGISTQLWCSPNS